MIFAAFIVLECVPAVIVIELLLSLDQLFQSIVYKKAADVFFFLFKWEL